MKKKEWIGLVAGFLGMMLACLLLRLFNRYVLMGLPLLLRMPVMILSYWIIAVPPLLLMRWHGDGLPDYGFRGEKPGAQILTGIALGVGTSLVLTLIPHLLGFGEFVDNGVRHKYLWQFFFEFVYFIVSVGAVEAFGFRGFIYERCMRLSGGRDSVAVAVSSVLFGLLHVFGGNPAQVILTACLGALYCFFRLRIRNCTTLSLIICHGVYDALITVWSSTLAA